MKLINQLGIILVVCLGGTAISAVLPFTFPASVSAMTLLLLLLLLRIIKPEQIGETADFLLKNMAFFFIPAGVEILESIPQVRGHIIVLLLICIITTIFTFTATAFTVTGVIWLQERLKGGLKQ